MRHEPFGKRHSRRFGATFAMAVAAAVASFATLPASAETDAYGNEINPVDPDTGTAVEYRFWVSGEKAETATIASSSQRVTASVPLATGTYSTPAASSSLEARFRTWLKSLGTSLKSTRFRHLIIVFK